MPPFFMNISALIAYLSDPANAADCAQLRAEKPTSINQIQQAIAAYPQAPVRDLLTLFRLQDANNHKFSHAHHLMLSDKAAQQASSSCLAAYHASKMQPGWHVADLCCGVGVDLQAFATRASHVFALDASDEVLAMARFNATVANHTNISFLCQRAETFSQPVDALYADPDRRKSGKRLINPETYSPPLSALLSLQAITSNLLIKCAPAVDYPSIQVPLPHTWECVAEGNTVKEMLLCTGQFATPDVPRRAVVLPSGITLNTSHAAIETSTLKTYLHTPHGAVVRAGLVQECGEKIGATMLHPKIALLTSDQPGNSELVESYKVSDEFPYSLKTLKGWIKAHNIGNLVIKTRGFPDTVESFRKKLRLSGNASATLFLIRAEHGFIAVVANLVHPK